MARLPRVRAELIAEFDEPVGAGIGRVRGGGWTVHDTVGNVLLLGADLKVRERFPVPGHFRDGGRYDWDVHPGGRWAVFAGVHRTECVGADGAAVWTLDHPARLTIDADPVPSCAVFHPGGDELWVFVPVLDDDRFDDAGFGTRRLVVDLPGMTATGTQAADESWGQDVLFHPDGQRTGSSSFDGHSVDGYWWRWQDGAGSVAAAGAGHPIDVHPDGTAWLGNESWTLSINRFEATAEAEDGDSSIRSRHEYDQASFMDRELILAVPRESDSHVLLDVGTLRVSALVEYPKTFSNEKRDDIAGVGDGTWITTSRRRFTGTRLRRWRPASQP
ncbi:hypothetical protein [Actinomadura oligospora]|uniref:hypothetical protein n=1 Tax=Actinomadura oligospora TaxID=111804 RepID=UPI0012F91C7F|nr:hypothetical protein [Actinomadura oligospora]